MSLLAKALAILSTLIAGTAATLPTSYDVAWTTPGINGSADSMPLGGGDIGINTWFENGEFLFRLKFEIKASLPSLYRGIPRTFILGLFQRITRLSWKRHLLIDHEKARS
jgi:hypothetical protein